MAMVITSQEQFVDLINSKVDLDHLAAVYIDHIGYQRDKGQGIPLNKDGQLTSYFKKSFEAFYRFNNKFKLENKSILEIGSGFGGFVLLCNLHGIKAFGVEPDRQMVWITGQLLCAFDFDPALVQPAKGESLPYKNESFDYVVSFQVLEHVEDPKKVLDESLRVLKPNGFIYFIFPNYNSFYEGHIEKIWFPFINKNNAEKYLTLLGLNKDKLKYVNFLKPKQIKEYLADYDDQVEIVSLGEKEFSEEYFNRASLVKIKNKLVVTVFKMIFSLRLNELIAKVMIYMQWYYPLVLTVRKKPGGSGS